MRKQRGFTMVELMVVILIIAILVGIVTVGFKYLSARVNTRSTEVTLQNLTSMLEAYKLAGQSQVDELDNGVIYKYALDHGDPIEPVAAGHPTRQSIVAEGGAWRDQRIAVYTGRVMRKIYSVPDNRKAMEQLPVSGLFTLPFLQNFSNDSEHHYQIGDVVMFEGRTFRATASNSGSTPGGAGWQEASGGSPLLLDAFGNPILYFPAQGLRIEDGSNGRVITSPDGQGFFASAGPDGRFGGAQGDDPMFYARDNIYSFEQ